MSDEYLGCVKAGRLFNLEPNAVHNAMVRGTLRSVKIGKFRKTTAVWMRDYLNSRRDQRNLRNSEGNKVYNRATGIYTVTEAAEKLGVSKDLLYKYHARGYIEFFDYKKCYIVTQKQLMQIQLVRETIRKNRSEKMRKK